MAEAEYTTTTALPVESVWGFVQDMDNWGRLLTGYRSHEKQSDTISEWTLKGDVGVLARTVKFRAVVTEWSGPNRVTFTLEGLNEALEGEGSFALARADSESSAEAATALAAPSQKTWLERLGESFFRLLFRLFRGRARRAPASTRALSGAGGARLTFRLRIEPGGPQAPMINAMLKPAMVAAAEDLANRIVGHLEEQERE